MLAEIWIFNTTFDGFFQYTFYEVIVNWVMSKDLNQIMVPIMLWSMGVTFALYFVAKITFLILGVMKVSENNILLTVMYGILFMYSKYLLTPLYLLIGGSIYLVVIIKAMLGYGPMF